MTSDLTGERLTYPHIDPEYDAEAIYLADRKRKLVENVDTAVYAYGKLVKLEPVQCEECMAKVRDVLRTYAGEA